MAGVDLQHRLGTRWRLAGIGQQLFQLPVQPAFRRHQTHRAVGQAVRCADIRHGIAQRFLHESKESGDILAGLCLRLGGPFGQRDQAEIRRALRHRLERLAVQINASVHPKAVHLIGQQQHLDAPRAEPLQLRRGGDTVKIGAGGIIDRGLVVLHPRDIIGQRTPFPARGGLEPGQPQQGLTPLEILIQAFLQHRAKGLPYFGIGRRIVLGGLFQLAQHLAGQALFDGGQDRAVLNHLARHIQRQIRRIHQPPHKAQVTRQQFRLVGDEHPADIELDPPLAVGIEQVERLGFGHKGQHRIFGPPLGAVMQRQRGGIPLPRHAAIEIGVFLAGNLALGAGPQGGTIGQGRGLRVRLVLQCDGHRHMARLRAHHLLDPVAFGVILGVLQQMQHDAGAARGGVLGGDRRDGIGAQTVRRPHRRLTGPGPARNHIDLLRHHERRIEPHAELADQLSILAALARRDAVHERLGARPGDGAQRLVHIGGGHADAIVLDDQAALVGVQRDRDMRLRIITQQSRLGNRLIAQFLAGIGGVRDQFAQENIFVRINRMHHHLQQLRYISLERMGLRGGNGVGRHGLVWLRQV